MVQRQRVGLHGQRTFEFRDGICSIEMFLKELAQKSPVAAKSHSKTSNEGSGSLFHTNSLTSFLCKPSNFRFDKISLTD